jgi:DNA-binding CsgD family transcriptional regulator/tetratricopeptide (TPR) repeat protein
VAESDPDLEYNVPPLNDPDLVGRERELWLLRQALETGPTLVLVEGEAGIGKSRLLAEFLAARDATAAGDLATDGDLMMSRTLVATCPPFSRPHTLGPIVDAIRLAPGRVTQLRLSQLAGALRPLFPEWAADLAPPPEHLEDATAVRHRLFRALSELLDSLGVVVLVIEDAHWADEATLEFLLFLSAGRDARISLVLSYRPEDGSASPLLRRLLARQPPAMTVRRIGLGPLDQDGTERLMSSMLAGERISAEFAVFVHRHTDGIPLAVEESIRLMRDRSDLTLIDGEWVRRELSAIEVPPGIRGAVLERAGHLSADGQTVLRAAAVLAEEVSHAVLAKVAHRSPARTRAGLAEAIDEGLLTQGRLGMVSFRHVLACRAVYESARADERIELHRRAGRALHDAGTVPPARLARHFREAGDTVAWRRYAEQAADAAASAGDELTASTLLHELITGAQLPGQDLLRLTRRLRFPHLIRFGAFQDLAEVLRGAVADPGLDSATRAELRAQAARVLIVMDEHDAACVELEEAIGDLGHNPVDAVRVMVSLGLPRRRDWLAAEHLRWLRHAAARLDSLPATDRMIIALTLVNALLLLGESEGWAMAAELPTATSSPQDREIVTHNLVNLGDLATRWGRYGEAERHLARALSLAEAYQHHRVRKMILVNRAHLAWLTGRWAGLERQAITLADDADWLAVSGIEAMLVAGLVHAVHHDQVRAADMLARVQAETCRRGVFEIMVEAAAALARLHLFAGRPADALAVTEEPMRIVAGKGVWLWAADLGPARVDALAAEGRCDEAAELVDRFAAWMRDRDIPAAAAGLLLSRAAFAQARAEHEVAASLFGQAATAFGLLPRPFEALLAAGRRGACLLAAGQREAGLTALASAASGLADLGASRHAAWLRRISREHAAVPRRPGRPDYRDRLSPREVDVAALVVDGLTNRVIAERLCLSPRTVERHLDSAMRKLGVRSRTALAIRVVEQDLVPPRLQS